MAGQAISYQFGLDSWSSTGSTVDNFDWKETNMATALIIPGVQVKTEFEPSPALFGPTGILGVIGVADRGPVLPTPVGNAGEFFDIFGPGSRYTMPEVVGAFANGVSRAVIARIEPGHGQKATLDLFDDDNEKVVTLEARAEGAWGNKIAVKVTQVKALSGKGVKYVNFETFLDGRRPAGLFSIADLQDVVQSFNVVKPNGEEDPFIRPPGFDRTASSHGSAFKLTLAFSGGSQPDPQTIRDPVLRPRKSSNPGEHGGQRRGRDPWQCRHPARVA